MKMTEFNQDKLIDELVKAISELPDTSIQLDTSERMRPQGDQPDAIAHVRTAGNEYRLWIETKRYAYPRDIRETVWKLRKYLARAPSDRQAWVPLLAAEDLSTGSRELLREGKIGYYDASGSLYLPGPRSFVLIEKPPTKRAQRAFRSVFSGRSAKVLHAAWSRGDNWFGVNELAQLAHVSPSTVSATLRALEQNDWVKSQGSGPAKERCLSNRRAMLDAWTEHQISTPPPATLRYFIPSAQPSDVIERVETACETNNIRYEITGEAAAQFYAPYLSHLSQVRCRMETRPRQDRVLESIEARRVTEGWNLAIIGIANVENFTLSVRANDCWYASDLQTYLDLLQAGGRARELANHLRQERLGA